MDHDAIAFIAATISGLPDHAATLRAQKASTARAFADALESKQPGFDRDTFLAACKLREDG